MEKRGNIVIAALLLTCVTGVASAAYYIGDSTTGYNWGIDSNWDTGSVPGPTETAVIRAGRQARIFNKQTVNAAYVGHTSTGSLRVYGAPTSSYTGELNTNYLYLCSTKEYGTESGTVVQYGGTVNVSRAMYLRYQKGTGTAAYNLWGGVLNVAEISMLGSTGKGIFNHKEGTFNTPKVVLGGYNYASLGTNTDIAYYTMTGGTLNVSTYMNVGHFHQARGHLKMGDQTGATGTITGTGNLTVKNAADAAGLGILQGFGNITMTGDLTNNGRVIADGWGGTNTSDRTLSMTTFASVKTVETSQVSGSGWYAQNKGKLVLPNLTVAAGSSDAYFGEDAAGAQNLVNSAKLAFNSVNGGSISMSLLASDRSELQGTTGNIIGVWDIDGSAFDFGNGSVDLTIKYDAALAATLGLTESNLKFYHKVGNSWVDITTSVDAANDMITANGVDSFSMFAVGTEVVPEPATMSLIGIGALAMFAKRSRK